MKRRLILAAAMLLCAWGAAAQNGKSIYQKYSDAEGVSAVYISPAMFRLIGKIPDLQIEGEDVNLAPIIKSLTGLYLIDSENPAINASLKADAEQFVRKGNYELLMEAKDSGETMRLFTVGTETLVNGFVMIADEGDETTFIFLDGKMNREELEKVIAESTKK